MDHQVAIFPGPEREAARQPGECPALFISGIKSKYHHVPTLAADRGNDKSFPRLIGVMPSKRQLLLTHLGHVGKGCPCRASCALNIPGPLPARERAQVLRKIERLQLGLQGDIKRLPEAEAMYRLRMGDYRVLFDVEGADERGQPVRRQTVDWSGLPCEARFWERKLGPAKVHYL